jgi:hypothetical protein
LIKEKELLTQPFLEGYKHDISVHSVIKSAWLSLKSASAAKIKSPPLSQYLPYPKNPAPLFTL